MTINSLHKWILFFVLALFVQIPAYATCSKSYTLGFFNGVWNTNYQADLGRNELRVLIGDIYNSQPINYMTFYNHTGSSVGATALQDLAETFIQRSAEIDASGELGKRFEYFWEFLGSSEPTFLDKLTGFLPNAASLFDSLYTAINTKLVAIISYFTSNPPTEADYATHNAQLDALAADGQKLMLVGHSQGNLFMNHAYDHILPTVGVDRVVAAHIAPASPTLRGDYVLANIDLVINLLRLQGITSVPANNLDINASRVDVSGHTLIGTYLDGTRDGRKEVKTMIETGIGKLKCPCTKTITSDLIPSMSDRQFYVQIGIGYDCRTEAYFFIGGYVFPDFKNIGEPAAIIGNSASALATYDFIRNACSSYDNKVIDDNGHIRHISHIHFEYDEDVAPAECYSTNIPIVRRVFKITFIIETQIYSTCCGC